MTKDVAQASLHKIKVPILYVLQWVGSLDLVPNEQADGNIIVKPGDSWTQQEEDIVKNVETILGENKLDAILCVAGGWAGGNANAKSVYNLFIAPAKSG